MALRLNSRNTKHSFPYLHIHAFIYGHIDREYRVTLAAVPNEHSDVKTPAFARTSCTHDTGHVNEDDRQQQWRADANPKIAFLLGTPVFLCVYMTRPSQIIWTASSRGTAG